MVLKNFRVDDRLVHGIVAGYWTNRLGITRIMVIDDKASEDELVRASLRMATPSTVNLSVLNLEKAINNIKNGNYDNQSVFVIAKSPIVFSQLQNAGIEVPAVYMGNITYSDDRLKVSKTVSVTQEEIKELTKMSQQGTQIISQLVPDDKPNNFMEMLAQAQNKGA